VTEVELRLFHQAIAVLDAQSVPTTDRWLWVPEHGWLPAEDERVQLYLSRTQLLNTYP